MVFMGLRIVRRRTILSHQRRNLPDQTSTSWRSERRGFIQLPCHHRCRYDILSGHIHWAHLGMILPVFLFQIESLGTGTSPRNCIRKFKGAPGNARNVHSFFLVVTLIPARWLAENNRSRKSRMAIPMIPMKSRVCSSKILKRASSPVSIFQPLPRVHVSRDCADRVYRPRLGLCDSVP